MCRKPRSGLSSDAPRGAGVLPAIEIIIISKWLRNYPGIFSPSRMTFSELYGRTVYGAEAVPALLIWMFVDGAYVPARK
jgi:hypothetical protein